MEFGSLIIAKSVTYFTEDKNLNLYLPKECNLIFFKWIKDNLEIKHYYGTGANAVKTQIWIALLLYLMVAILHKSLKLPRSLRNTLQILSVHPFEKCL